MSIVEFVLVFGDFMGEREETPLRWNWKSFTTMTLPIAVSDNDSYDDLVASIIKSEDLDYELSDVVISYLMSSREKMHPTIINNERPVYLYMMDIGAVGFGPILRINVIDRIFEEPLNSSLPPPRRSTVDAYLNEYENDGDHPMNMKVVL
ncbi:hypothetical protein FXO38_22465 [Capsicum annuum]|nr:hypothetical protein FXO38_22465 [Capsicum annuum]